MAVNLYRQDPALAAQVLNECLADGSVEEFLLALRHATKAFGGMPEFARATGVYEKKFCNMLSKKGIQI